MSLNEFYGITRIQTIVLEDVLSGSGPDEALFEVRVGRVDPAVDQLDDRGGRDRHDVHAGASVDRVRASVKTLIERQVRLKVTTEGHRVRSILPSGSTILLYKSLRELTVIRTNHAMRQWTGFAKLRQYLLSGGLDRAERDWKGLERTGKDWKGLERARKDWKGLERTGKDWKRLEFKLSVVPQKCLPHLYQTKSIIDCLALTDVALLLKLTPIKLSHNELTPIKLIPIELTYLY